MTDIEQAAEYVFDALDAARKGVEKMPPSRERSLAQTKIDEAHMWFQRAIPPINRSES